MAGDNTIESRIDQLLSKDFSKTSTSEIVNLITGGQDINQPYVDMQSEAGFDSELAKNQEQVDSIISSLEPGPPPIPMKKIEELSCNFEGDELYSRILLESVRINDINLYRSLLNSSALNERNLSAEDLGIKTKISSLKTDKKLPSEGIVNFLKDKDKSLLEKINEKLFDNVDPLLVGKPSNSGSKKKREINILGFKIPLEFIMSGKKIVHVKIGGEEKTNKQALEDINSMLAKQNQGANPCDFDGVDENINSERIDEYDANFFPDGDDPILDPDCDTGIPEDPITGDVISTKESFDDIQGDFCDPPAYDFSGLNPDDPDPEPAPVDVDAIQACMDSALDKTKKIDEDSKLLARWQNIEKSLDEIHYHYDVVWEYQRTLAETWRARVPVSSGGDPNNLDLAIQILTYRDQEEIKSVEILLQEENLGNEKKLFLENNPLLTDNIFNFSVLDLENSSNLTDSELSEIFSFLISANKSPVSYNSESQTYSIQEGVDSFRKNQESIVAILIQGNFIESLKTEREEIKALKESTLQVLVERKGVPITIDDLEVGFKIVTTDLTDPYGQGSTQKYKNAQVFDNVILPVYTYDSYGYQFLQDLKKFSVRFKDTKFDKDRGELKFTLAFMSDLGMPIPYKKVKKTGKISLKQTGTDPLEEVNEPDQEKIKIGNEHASGGLLINFTPSYLKSYQYLTIDNIKTGQPDVAKFYDYIDSVINTNKSKQDIINKIVEDRGILYGQLIEKSSSNFLFFTAEERGDNDSRDPAKLRPSSFNAEGEPTPVFTEFYGNFKPKWDAKYKSNRETYIDPALSSLKEQARKAGEGLGKTLPTSDQIGVRLFENYFDTKKKIEQIEEIILYAAQKRSEIEESLKPENIEKSFADIKCSSGQTDPNDPENCPPACCGQPGSDFKTDNYLLSLPPSSDCPTMFQKCWWKQFSKDLTKVGLLPYPNGLPPIEKADFFLTQGPSIRLGLKYWPVGYLPPAFIPIPIPNPIDAQPFIRIPLPMIWTIINPIVIPLPLNLGILVIFIPLIGGFMPTPLVYLKEFIGGNSLFLTGIRGPRFIPRKSDPELKDPMEKIKQLLSFGIPDKLIPLPGFGLDNLDSPARILADLQSNLTKIFDSVPPPGNLDQLRQLQDKELEIKKKIDDETKNYLKKEALLDIPKPDLEGQREELKNLITSRKNALKQVIMDYIDKGIPDPKAVYFPKDKDKLKIDIPGIVKSLRILKEMKASFVPIKCSGTIDFKDEIREVLKLLKIPTPPQYILDNFNVSNANKIFLKSDKDPRLMTDEEFRNLVLEIRGTSLIITQILLRGNKFSVLKKIRKGAFSITEECELQGTFAFPAVKLTNSAPFPLRFLRKGDPVLTAMYLRIMEGMIKIEYTREDFARYVRYFGESPELVIRVKDLKKLVSRKIGLSKRGPFDPERPIDLEEPLISNYPHPEGPLCCLESLNGGFGNAIAAFELPTVFPVKQDQITQTPGAGGIIQVTIPGSKIKSFIKTAIGELLDSGALEKLLPELSDVNSPKFTNLDPNDIQKIARNLVRDVLNPESPNIPPFLELTKIPVLPPARPTDLIEQALIGMGSPPPARIVYSLFWKYFKSLPKTPLSDKITLPTIEISANILSKIPWPLTVLIGRNLLNIINPIAMSDDHPVWRRMSVKNPYYVVYLDEFLRSAADVSGLYKFFLGAADPTYPIPELQTELKKEFNVKKY